VCGAREGADALPAAGVPPALILVHLMIPGMNATNDLRGVRTVALPRCTFMLIVVSTRDWASMPRASPRSSNRRFGGAVARCGAHARGCHEHAQDAKRAYGFLNVHKSRRAAPVLLMDALSARQIAS
jgi:hypothetical protein